MIGRLAFAAALIVPLAARAQETGGCGAFKWDVGQERALLAKAGPASAGTTLPAPPAAVALTLAPLASAALPKPPERQPRDPASFAGSVTVPIAEPGLYRVSLSAEAWIDAVQTGAYRKTEAFGGIRDCDGLRKSVTFRLESGSVVLQVSGVGAASISLAVTPDR